MKHKYLASFPSDRWERLKRDAKRRGVSYNVVINDALDDTHMRSLYGSGLFEDDGRWHDCKKEKPESNKWLIFALIRKLGTDYYIGTYDENNDKYYYVDNKNVAKPEYWFYLPELLRDEDLPF